MGKLLAGIVKSFVILVVITVIGQIRIKDQSLEHRYHRFVNSPAFQKAYWTTLTPVTWTVEKAQDLIQAARQNAPFNEGAAR